MICLMGGLVRDEVCGVLTPSYPEPRSMHLLVFASVGLEPKRHRRHGLGAESEWESDSAHDGMHGSRQDQPTKTRVIAGFAIRAVNDSP